MSDLKVVARPTTAAVDFAAVPLRPSFTNIVGSSQEIAISRAPLDVGALSATVRDVALDPSTSGLIRPGRPCRVTALVGGAWSPVFTGRVLEGSVSYDLDPAVPAARRARVVLSAVDATSRLAQTRRSGGFAALSGVRQVLESAGVPFVVNGDSRVSGTVPATVSYNPSATALDQVAIARDTARGHAWVDRFDRLVVNDASAMPTALRTTLGDAAVSGASITFSTSDLINEVSVKLARYRTKTGATDEVDLGPYRDSASIAANGVRSAEYALQGLTNAQVRAWAAAVLAANATPARRAESVRVPLATPADVAAWSTVDLGDLVRVNLSSAGLDLSLRVTGVEHSVTYGKWMMTLHFAAPGTVSGPVATPSPLSAPTVAPLDVVGAADTFTTNGNGDVVIAHGLGAEPTTVSLQGAGVHNFANVRTDATSITARVRNASTGATVASGANISLYWLAAL